MVLMSLIISTTLSLVVALAGKLLTKKAKIGRILNSSFECGFDSSAHSLLPFSLRFYLLANMFLIFDIELILLFPFLSKLVWMNIWASLLIFSVLLLVLSLGLFHEWNQKMLEWAS